jgi:hypothetical protein
MNTLDILTYSLLPAGQLFARVINYNGSLDNWWLLLLIPLTLPYSFLIPFNYIINIISILLLVILNTKKGFMSIFAIDRYVLLPIILKFYSPYLLSLLNIEPGNITYNAITFIAQILIGSFSNLNRCYNICPNIGVNNIVKSIMDSIISHNVAELFVLLLTKYSAISYCKDDLTLINSIYWSIGYICIYTVNNMFIENNKTNYCNIPIGGTNTDIFFFMISIFILIIIKYQNLLPNYNSNISEISGKGPIDFEL